MQRIHGTAAQRGAPSPARRPIQSLIAATALATALCFLNSPAASAGDTAQPAPAAATEARAKYTFDVPLDGPVHVTIRPHAAGTLALPVTAENVKAEGLKYELKKNWESFTANAEISLTGPNPVLTYDWPDGTLPWPIKVSNWLSESDRRWFADTFRIIGPAEAAVVLPPGTTVMECREWDCPKREEKTADGRVRVVFDVPDGKKVNWMGVIYSRPWEDRYAVYGESPTPVYYPKVLAKNAEYMERVKRLYDAAREFYQDYAKRLTYTPDGDIRQYAISWLQGYGGAFCTGRNCYYDYRRVAAFEWPPLTDGGRLMGAYHEMGHCFQPEGLPDYLGSHTWTAWITMDYDWNSFPTPAEVQKRKEAGGKADTRYVDAYKLYRTMREKKMVPPVWYKWPEPSPEIEAYLKEQKCPERFGVVRECASTCIMLTLERELTPGFWGRFGKVCNGSGVLYEGVAEPVQQQIVTALLSAAAGQDLTKRLTELTDCDLAVELRGAGQNLLADDKWTLDAWQPSARFERDTSVRRGGSAALKLTCPEPNDARLVQKVAVEPKTYYLVTGWIRTEGIPDGLSGVTIGVIPDPVSQTITGKRDWKRLGRVFFSGDSGETTIALRLGWNGQPVAGTVWFDDVELFPLLTKQGWQRLAPAEARVAGAP